MIFEKPLRNPINPNNWYWFIGGDQTQAYSSASGSFVPAADATFQAWKAVAGNIPGAAPTTDALGAILVYCGAPRPTDATVVGAWQNAGANNLNTVNAVIFKVLFNHENRIRSLAGQPSITAQQFISGIAALL